MSVDPNDFNLRRSDRIADDRPVWLFIGGTGQQVEIKDLSDQGACFFVPRPVSVNKAVRVQIGHGGDAADFEAIVVRCDPSPVGSYEVAVRFDASGVGLSGRFAGRISPTIHH